MKNIFDEIARRETANSPPPLPKEPAKTYGGLLDDEGKAPDLQRALSDFPYYRRNREVLHAAKAFDRDEAARLDQEKRNAERREAQKNALARREAVRQLDIEHREKEAVRVAEVEADREAEIEERVRAIREIQEQ